VPDADLSVELSPPWEVTEDATWHEIGYGVVRNGETEQRLLARTLPPHEVAPTKEGLAERLAFEATGETVSDLEECEAPLRVVAGTFGSHEGKMVRLWLATDGERVASFATWDTPEVVEESRGACAAIVQSIQFVDPHRPRAAAALRLA
jgi:hypothetical protein